MNFSTKAQTLAALKGRLKSAYVLPLVIINSTDYFRNKHKAIQLLKQTFPTQMLIVRSSASNEDTYYESAAGKYLSILNVDATSNAALQTAIESVIHSYKSEENYGEVLIQPMLNDIKLSGVAFTCDINNGAPYYIINYAMGTDTRAVTGGSECDKQKLQTFIAYKNGMEFIRDNTMRAVITVLQELEALFPDKQLDVEFGITASDEVYIFQTRQITNQRKWDSINVSLDVPLEKTYKKISKLMRPHPFMQGDTTCFGVMPDWNPAEILGARPKRLAVTLYKELITDNIWARQRNDYGYCDMTAHPLMVSFCGIPYIDVRVSFNSFIPKELHPKLAAKLANYYIHKFKNNPTLHDKVEFEIVYSCYYFGLTTHLQSLLHHGFTDNEIKRIEFSLLNLTNNIISDKHALFKRDIENANTLFEKHNAIVNGDIPIIDKIYWLIEVCKCHGTLPFAGAARAAFIAVQFLRSFVERGICSYEEYNVFMNSLNTISKQLSTDAHALSVGDLAQDAFLLKYGHIRPDTYNILSPCYKEAFQAYFGQTSRIPQQEKMKNTSFSFNAQQMARIEWECIQNGLLLSAEQLIAFIREAIEGREYVKYVFTRSVSEILNLIKSLGMRMDISPEDMAHLNIDQVKQLYVDLYFDNLSSVLRNNIDMNKRQYACAVRLKLPNVIVSPDSIYSFYLSEDEPSFITAKMVTGETVCIDGALNVELDYKIVFVSSADPGYDFLFTKHILGLITEYGGANSHMAIRCAEMGIPAVIGAGEKNYTQWKQFVRINIDCLNHKVNGL